MQIIDMDLPHGLILAPMAGYTDRAMRQICRSFGAEMTVTEMVSAKAICFGDRKTAALARIMPDECPCALQLFGSDPDFLAEAVRRMDRGVPGGIAPSAIDLNLGCPMRKITGNGEGGALLRDPRQIERIVSAMTNATDLPVTVKIRSGWDEETVNAAECARAAEAGGAQAVAVHARTVRQVYSGTADWRVIAAVKEAVKIPVIGNGDVTGGDDARRMKDETGCDGIMVARAAVGRPWIFREIACALDGRAFTPPTLGETVEIALSQLRAACADKGERTALPEARKQIALYFHGRRGAAQLRKRVNAALSFGEVEEILRTFLKSEEG